MNIKIKQMHREFIICHDGIINKTLHIIGIVLLAFGLLDKNIVLFIIAVSMQELGHVYQYLKTKEYKYSPLFCIKSQALFAYPLFLVMALYILY